MIRNPLVSSAISALFLFTVACSDGADGIKGGGDKKKDDVAASEIPAGTTETTATTNPTEPDEITAGVDGGKSKLSARTGEAQGHTADESTAGCSGLPAPYAATFSTKEDKKAKVAVKGEGISLLGWTGAGGEGGGTEFGPVRGTKPSDCPALKEFMTANRDAQYIVQINVSVEGNEQSFYGVYGETNPGVRANHAACLQQAAALRGTGVDAFCVQVRGKGEDVKL